MVTLLCLQFQEDNKMSSFSANALTEGLRRKRHGDYGEPNTDPDKADLQ